MNMCFRAERAGFFDTLLFVLTTLRADRACSSITNPNIAAHRGSLRRASTFLTLSPGVLRAGAADR